MILTIVASSAKTIGAFNTQYDGVNLHRLTLAPAADTGGSMASGSLMLSESRSGVADTEPGAPRPPRPGVPAIVDGVAVAPPEVRGLHSSTYQLNISTSSGIRWVPSVAHNISTFSGICWVPSADRWVTTRHKLDTNRITQHNGIG